MFSRALFFKVGRRPKSRGWTGLAKSATWLAPRPDVLEPGWLRVVTGAEGRRHPRTTGTVDRSLDGLTCPKCLGHFVTHGIGSNNVASGAGGR